MAVQKIPTFSDPFYDMTVVIEGQSYVFDFRFNQRESCWYFSIALPDGTELLSGVKVVCRREFLHRAANVLLPRGLLIALPNSEDSSPPGLEELGVDKRVTLTYFETGTDFSAP